MAPILVRGPIVAVARPQPRNALRRATPRSAACPSETRLLSVAAPVALLAAAQSHGVGAALAPLVTPAADFFAAQGLPSALIKYGHPGNMAVVLGAMGLYGCGYLGAVIRTSSDKQAVKAARDLHPKLGAGMAIFFALGATGGLMSLAMQGKPLAESPHAITGVTGLVLLAFQAMLPLFFKDDPSTRTAHAYFGASLLALFTVHAGLGVKLALSL